MSFFFHTGRELWEELGIQHQMKNCTFVNLMAVPQIESSLKRKCVRTQRYSCTLYLISVVNTSTIT